MYQTVYFDDFKAAFIDCNRLSNFSVVGLKALFDYLEDLESNLDEMIQLDVIALCCEYNEVDYADSEIYEQYKPDGDLYEFVICELEHSVLVREG